MIELRPYTGNLKTEWDRFVGSSKNGSFLFMRDYMEYHSDRFPDYSFLVFKDGSLVAVFPCTRKGSEASSHAGLTFGGVICDERMTTPLMLSIFGELLGHLKSDGVTKLVYKPPPRFYHIIPAEEDLYALFRYGGRLCRRDVGSILSPADHPGFSEGRRWAVQKARKAGIIVRECNDFANFWALLEETLWTRHGVRPVHSLAEILTLAKRFPENIRLFVAMLGDDLLAGTVIYENPTVAHTQYMASSAVGRKMMALDLLLNELISSVYSSKRWFSFGISTEQEGMLLNEGLIQYKEAFGARACVQDFYEITI